MRLVGVAIGRMAVVERHRVARGRLVRVLFGRIMVVTVFELLWWLVDLGCELHMAGTAWK
jgi:hypothetical protein